MSYLEAPVTEEFLSTRGWLDGLADGATPGFELFRFFLAKAEGLPEEDREGRAAFAMLGAASILSFHPASRAKPFTVMMQVGDARSAAIDDFGVADVDTLAAIAGSVPILPLRARFADVAWEAGRLCQRMQWRMGVLAARSYYQVALAHLAGEDDMTGRGALQRGLELAWQFKKQTPETLDGFWNLVESTARSASAGDKPGLLLLLADECVERRNGLAPTLAPLVEAAAERHRATAGPTLSHAELWGRSARLWTVAGDRARSQSARLREAEALVEHAEAGAANAMFAAHWMKMALEALRRSGAEATRISAIHARLLQLQQATTTELTHFSQEINVEDLHIHVAQAVSGKSFQEALFGLARMENLVQPARIREQALEQARQHPLSGSMPVDLMNVEGATVARRGSLLDGSEEERAIALEAASYHNAARFEFFIRAEVMVTNAAQTIFNEHHPTEYDVARYVVGHPFVPESISASITRGLQQGFDGDWLAVGSYLIPRFETLVRYWMRRRGVITSAVTDDGFQKERSLSQLLQLPQAIDVFGESLLFELKCHLVEEWGFNLRNDHAHGLSSDGEVAGRGTRSLWWLLWRVLLTPLITSAVQRTSTGSVGNQDTSGEQAVDSPPESP